MNIVFAYGFNVTEREARGWNAEMFKRLWQSGCNAAYYAVTWRGDCGLPAGMYYHENVHNAFLTAPSLAAELASLTGTELAPGDEVLQIRDTPPSMLSELHYQFPFTIDMGHYAWHKQEMGKGRLSSVNPLIAGTTWAGWERQRFQVWKESPSGNTGGYAYEPLAPAEANAMTDSELRSTPVFLHSPSDMFSSTISSNMVAEILACGIPALSGPAGSRTLSEDILACENINVNNLVNVYWPRKTGSYPSRWLHSDLKNVAFPFVRRLFERIAIE